MVDHTAVYSHDPTMAVAGHQSWLVHVLEQRGVGLHCGGLDGDYEADGCGWYGGGFQGRWAEKHMREAWDKHVAFVQFGGIITHGQAANVVAGICKCVTCVIPYRHLAAAIEDKQRGAWSGCGLGQPDCACTKVVTG